MNTLTTDVKGDYLKNCKRSTKICLIILMGLLISNLVQAQLGLLDLSFDLDVGTNKTVYTTALQSDGKIIIGGEFESYNGIARNKIARLNANGSLDTTFNPGGGANDNVLTTAIQSDGKIIIAGNFNFYNGTSRRKIARLNTDGTLDPSFDPGIGVDYAIHSIAIQTNGKIIIGGFFSYFHVTPINNIARLNSDGSLDMSFNPGSGTDGIVYGTAIQADGKIIIVGDFNLYNGVVRNRIARLNLSGSLDASFSPGSGANFPIHSVSIQNDGKIVIGGEFTSYQGLYRGKVARITQNAYIDNLFDSEGGGDYMVNSTAVRDDGKVIIGGNFGNYNGTPRSNIAQLNLNGSLDISFNPGGAVSGIVRSIAIQGDGKIVVGGSFTSYHNGKKRTGVVRLLGVKTTGIQQSISNIEHAKYFPNPFSSTCTLYCDEALNNATLSLYNATGLMVKKIEGVSGQSFTFFRDHLPSGLYFMRLSQNNLLVKTDKLLIAD